MSRKSVTVENVEIHCVELPFCDATDLLADLMAIVAPAGGDFNAGMAHAGDALGRIAREIVGGALTRYLTRLLATTTMIVKGEGGGRFDLIDSKDALNRAFTGRQKFIYPAVKLALEVNFKGFLDGLALIGIKIPKLMPAPPSADSSQSTTATG